MHTVRRRLLLPEELERVLPAVTPCVRNGSLGKILALTLQQGLLRVVFSALRLLDRRTRRTLLLLVVVLATAGRGGRGGAAETAEAANCRRGAEPPKRLGGGAAEPPEKGLLAALGKREGAAAAGAAVAAEVPPKPANRGGAAGLSPVAGEGAAKRGFSLHRRAGGDRARAAEQRGGCGGRRRLRDAGSSL